MDQLQVAFGVAARDALCAAFDSARSTIDAEYYSISDPEVITSLNHAAARHVNVCIHVEGNPHRYGHKPDAAGSANGSSYDTSVVKSIRQKFSDDVHIWIESHPDVLVHGKAAVVDGSVAFIGTANPTSSSFANPGDVLVTDSSPRDVAAVEASIGGAAATSGDYVVTGPATLLRSRVDHLLDSSSDLRIASEDLSDREVVHRLVERKAGGRDDRILIEAKGRISPCEARAVGQLRHAGIEVRSFTRKYMHEKYVDAGDEIYVGSANLTRNGLDEAREVGLVAPAAAFGSGAAALRANFDRNWNRAAPLMPM